MIVVLQVAEMAVSELPGNPNAVWTVKKRMEGKSKQAACSYLILVSKQAAYSYVNELLTAT